MATATAVGTIDAIRRRLESGAVRRGLPSKLDEVLDYLKFPLCTLRSVLSILMEDQSLDAAVRMRKIKIVLYELEDLLDELEYHGSIRHGPSRRTWKATWFWLSSPFLLHTNVAPRLDMISRRLRYLTDRSVEFCWRQHTIALPRQHEERFGFDRTAIIGRDREKQYSLRSILIGVEVDVSSNKTCLNTSTSPPINMERREYIKELLLQNDGDSLSILPIVGQPGLGKTSLARLVFEDEGEDWEFDFRVWISLDKDLDLTKIGTRIISEANKSVKGRILQVCRDYSSEAPFQLEHDVQGILHNSSCLIVLDNLISMNANLLINLKNLFGGKQKCAKVIVTTSSTRVAEVMRTSSSYNLCGLSEEQCWTVFSEKAFGDKDAIVDPQYTEIGKKIARRCKGVPMLAQFLGSMVRNQGMNTWLAARDEEFWELEERFFPKSTIFSSFMEIYYSMHHTLKLCFLYLSVFPRGSTIDKDELIRQWSALDFFESKLGVFSASLLGEIYTGDLLEASILEAVETSSVERKRISSSVALRVNNLAYDFLRYLTRDDVVHLEYGTARSSGPVGKPPFRYATLTCYSEESAADKYLVSRAKAVFFRNCVATKPIADVFPVLRSTRLLDLSGCPFEELPASVDQLNQLRYLNISGFRISALPNELGCLQNLEFLDISKTCIEVLPTFIGTFRKLKYLNMHGCDKLPSLPPALGDLKGLENLNLSCCSQICKLPVSICGLGKLKRLDLSHCTSLDQLPHPFQLESLENLNLEGCFRLKQVPESFGSLPSLRNLNLAGCSSLKQLPLTRARLLTCLD